MRKNRMMRAASALMVAVLLTTSTISGTFAKYVTTAEASDTARVAKWGVQIDMSALADEANDLFTDTYAADSATTIANTVVASEDAVAPGTKHDGLIAFTLTGTPEVAVKVEFEVTNAAKNNVPLDVVLPAGTYKDWTKAPYTDTFDVVAPGYYPIVYTLTNGAGVELAKGNLDTIKAFLETTLSGEYEANTNLAEMYIDDNGTPADPSDDTILSDGTYKLSWAWAYGAFDGITDADRADTFLGNIAAGIETLPANASINIDFAIAITVTQID